MPRHGPFPHATVFAVNEPSYYRIKNSWFEEGVFGGSEYLVQPGPIFPGSIIALCYEGRKYLCKLIERDSAGNILIFDRNKKLVRLKFGSFKIEGFLKLDSRRPIQVPEQQPSQISPLIVTDALLSWRNDRQGSNLAISLKWVKMTGEAPDEVRALGWLNSVRPDDRERVVRTREAGLKNGEIYFIDYDLRAVSGLYHPVHSFSTPIIERGVIVGWHGAAHIKP